MQTPGARTAWLEQTCRERGLALTVQRRVVLEALADSSRHPTADSIFETVSRKFPEISRTTVYRVLDVLVEHGIARKVCHPGAAARYEIRAEPHHHLVCMECESMVDLHDPLFDSLPLPKLDSGFRIEEYSIQFRGLCAKCAQKQALPSGTPERSRSKARSRKPQP